MTNEIIEPPEVTATGGSPIPAWAERMADADTGWLAQIGPDSPYRTAYLMAQTAHAGQTDKTGADYFTAHILPVTERAVALAPPHLRERVAIVALLHDAVEDTRERPDRRVTLDDIAREFGDEIRADVDAVSHRVVGVLPNKTDRWESYPKLIKRTVERGGCALIVKVADNRVNYEGLHNIADGAVRERLSEKYTKAFRRLWPAYAAEFAQQPMRAEVQWENEVGDRR